MNYRKYLKYYNFDEDTFEEYNNPIGELVANVMYDLALYKKMTRIFSRYLKTNKMNYHLLINHLVAFLRAFQIGFALEWLFENIDEMYHKCLRTALHFVGIIHYPDAKLDAYMLQQFEEKTPYTTFAWREQLV